MGLEVGQVYQDGPLLFLALSEGEAVYRAGGAWFTARAAARWSRREDLTVGELCRRWRVSLAELDAMTAERLPKPAPMTSPFEALLWRFRVVLRA